MDYVVEMRNITKTFPGIVANNKITFQLKKGEIHALLGENGAGKSTLMSILFGLYQPDEGEIYINGQKVRIESPNHANDLKIGMVHQHFKLVHNFTVTENIILGKEDTKYGFIHKEDAVKKIRELSERYRLYVDPDAIIEDITVGMQQRVEILKMLYRDAEILIFDEPTAVLTPQEIEELMKIMKNLAAEGKSIIFITHKLNEIMKVADRCTVLRRGQCIGTVNVNDVTIEEMAEMMVGRKVSFELNKKPAEVKETILEVSNLTVVNAEGKEAVKNVSFTVRRGEIVCIAGIDGNGQSELLQAITGLLEPKQGVIKFKGKDITHESIRNRTLAGIGHIPEDRHRYGLVLDFTLAQNLILQTYFEPRFQNHGFFKFDAIEDYANKLIERFDIRSGQGAKTIARSMSGGNQQKAIIAREVDREPDLLIAIQPTRGLDVGATEYIHNQLIAHRDKGKAVLLMSLELDEVLNLSDRILVMFEGEIVANVQADEITENELGLYMSGAKRSEVNA